MRLLPSSEGVLTIGDWELVLELGDGLYLARKTGPKRFARLGALRLLGVSADGDDPFRSEIARASAAAHPLVSAIQDAGDLAGQRFVVTQYVEGGSLRELVPAGGTVPCDIAATIGIDALTALDAVHRSRDKAGRTLVHGAITKAALVVGVDGRTRLSDLGLGWLSRRGEDPLGSKRYASPSVLSGDAPSTLDDIYAVGRILHEIVAGTAPDGPLPLLSSLDSNVPVALGEAIARATAPEPDHRFRTADAFAAALEGAAPPAGARQVGRWVEARHAAPLAERRAALGAWSEARAAALGYHAPSRARVVSATIRKKLRRHRRLVRATAVVALAAMGAALGLVAWASVRGAPPAATVVEASAPSQEPPPPEPPLPTESAASAAPIEIDSLPTSDPTQRPKARRPRPRKTEELSNPYR